MAPRETLPPLGRDAGEQDEQVEVIAVGFNGEVRGAAHRVAERGQQLRQYGHRIRFGVGLDGTHYVPREPAVRLGAGWGGPASHVGLGVAVVAVLDRPAALAA